MQGEARVEQSSSGAVVSRNTDGRWGACGGAVCWVLHWVVTCVITNHNSELSIFSFFVFAGLLSPISIHLRTFISLSYYVQSNLTTSVFPHLRRVLTS